MADCTTAASAVSATDISLAAHVHCETQDAGGGGFGTLSAMPLVGGILMANCDGPGPITNSITQNKNCWELPLACIGCSSSTWTINLDAQAGNGYNAAHWDINIKLFKQAGVECVCYIMAGDATAECNCNGGHLVPYICWYRHGTIATNGTVANIHHWGCHGCLGHGGMSVLADKCCLVFCSCLHFSSVGASWGQGMWVATIY